MGRTKKAIDTELVQAALDAQLNITDWERTHYHSKVRMRELLIISAFGGLIARGAGTNVDAMCSSAIALADAMMERL